MFWFKKTKPVVDESVVCDLCGATAPSVEAAINADWEPSYWDGDEETGNPICPDCATQLCDPDDGELVRKTVPSEMAKLKGDVRGEIRGLVLESLLILRGLAEKLEVADCDLGGYAGPLITSHFAVLDMFDELDASDLGEWAKMD